MVVTYSGVGDGYGTYPNFILRYIEGMKCMDVSNKNLDLEELYSKCKYYKLSFLIISQETFDIILKKKCPTWFSICTKYSFMKNMSNDFKFFIGWITYDVASQCEVYVKILKSMKEKDKILIQKIKDFARSND